MRITEDDEEDEVFVISYTGRTTSRKRPPPMCMIDVGENTITVLIDMGASVNILDTAQYDQLKPKPQLQDTKAKIFTYGGDTPIPLQGVIEVKVKHGDRSALPRFHVTKDSAGSLKGCHSAEDLGLVIFARQIHHSHADKIMEEFPILLEGLGCLKGVKVKLHIDRTVKLVALRHRRVPFHLRPLVEAKLERLEKMRVIEKVSDPPHGYPH